MVGIVAYGAYLPRLRLNRMSAYQAMGWFAPALITSAQGERAFCNWDEDSLTMAVAAARDCLKGINKSALAGLYLASTTLPFADRSNAGVVKTALNLKDEMTAADFTSSLKAGTSALLAALDAAVAGDKRVLVVATDKRETKAAGFPELWYGDGAAAVLMGAGDVIAEFVGAHSISCDFVDHYRGSQNRFDYTWEERWVRDEGYAKLIPAAIQGLCAKLSLAPGDIDRLAFPCPFKAEHRRLAAKLGVAPEKLIDGLHDVAGETGAAHPLLLLIRALEQAKPGERIVVAGFGQGVDALCFRVTDRITSLAPRNGAAGALADKTTVDNYAMFLKFRNLIQTESGIRAEAPTQTALTALWRNRAMILGLVGGRCPKCGTPQFPKAKICVNPKCLAVGEQEDYEFAGRPAVVKTFTGDMLAVSMKPPAIYGMVQFEGGGRMMADFTDCELENVNVGLPVTMSFRRRYLDEHRGFSGYFWKAVPIQAAREEKKAEPAPAGMTVADVFAAMPKAFRADKAAGMDVVFQYKLSGPAGGEWHLVVKDGTLAINQGAHSAPTVTLITSDEDFVKMTQGKLNAMEAFTKGRLKIEGDLMKSQLLGKLFRF